MAKRLEVILQDSEYREIQRAARSRHTSIAEWVRQALQLLRRHSAGRRFQNLGPSSTMRLVDVSVVSVVSGVSADARTIANQVFRNEVPTRR
jgi:hypothetical protein